MNSEVFTDMEWSALDLIESKLLEIVSERDMRTILSISKNYRVGIRMIIISKSYVIDLLITKGLYPVVSSLNIISIYCGVIRFKSIMAAANTIQHNIYITLLYISLSF